jgi:ribosomal protein S18 acetylase RimI-like enzyme
VAEIVVVNAEQAREILLELVALLQDAVAGGASIGFLPPLSDDEATASWDGIINDLASEKRVLLVAVQDGQVVGSVQLEPAGRANGAHRAEVQRLIVHRSARRQGLGRALMDALEEHARTIGRTLLVLDTREGDPSETLYARCGYTRVGVIPRYARSVTGALDGTVYYYKHLDTGK